MSRQAPERSVSSFEHFLEIEERSNVRHEFIYGNLFVMAGGTDRHDHVAGGLYARMFLEALKQTYRVYKSDILIRTPEDIGYYPDVFVLQDSSFDTPRVKRAPSIVIEVLSPSTESIDRGEKLRNYRSIPSLEQYVLLSQNEPLAEVYSKHNGTWQHEILLGDAVLEFSSIGFSLPLAVLFLTIKRTCGHGRYENLPSEAEG
jgi:Uma2 family endonuclease